MPDCSRCKIPMSETEDWTFDHSHKPTHWSKSDCIESLMEESDLLRSQLAAEMALSGAIARLESWLKADNLRTLEVGTDEQVYALLHEADCETQFFQERDTLAAALTAALDESEGIA